MKLTGVIYRYGKWISWLLILLSGIGVSYWGYGLTAPSELIIATGKEGSYTFDFGRILKKQIEKNTDFTVELKQTTGSADNRAMLLSGEADLAILRTGDTSLENLSAISPLWFDYLHIITRKLSKIEKIEDLKRKSVALGNVGSANRELAVRFLKHYGVKLEELDDTSATFTRLLRDENYVGALTVNSLLNPQFKNLIQSDQFEWLTVPNIAGASLQFPFFDPQRIPGGSIPTVNTPLPQQSVESLGTLTILASKASADFELIEQLLPAIHRFSIFEQSPILLGSEFTKDQRWKQLPHHPATRIYYEPYSGISLLAHFIEKLNYYKEMIFFSILIVVFVLVEWKRVQAQQEEKVLLEEVKKLESWLQEMIHIEQEQKKTKDLRVLRQFHQDALTIKEQALKDVIGKEIQNSEFFQTFMQQCIHVVHEIEYKMSGFRP